MYLMLRKCYRVAAFSEDLQHAFVADSIIHIRLTEARKIREVLIVEIFFYVSYKHKSYRQSHRVQL